jgi:hypothetical protein
MEFLRGLSPQPPLASHLGTATLVLGRRGRKTRIRACHGTYDAKHHAYAELTLIYHVGLKFSTRFMVVLLCFEEHSCIIYIFFAKSSIIYLSEFHLLPYSFAIVTHITPFSGASTKISRFGDFKHGFAII